MAATRGGGADSAFLQRHRQQMNHINRASAPGGMNNPVFQHLMSGLGQAMNGGAPNMPGNFTLHPAAFQMQDQIQQAMQGLGGPQAVPPPSGGNGMISPIARPMQGFAQMAQAGVDAYNANPLNQFPSAPGGGTPFSGLFGLGSRLMGRGGGLY